MSEPSEKPKPSPIMNPPDMSRTSAEPLIAALAPIIARLCAKPTEAVEQPKKPRKR